MTNLDALPLDVGEPGLRLGVRPKQRVTRRVCICGDSIDVHSAADQARCYNCPCPKFQAKPKSPRRKSKSAKAVDVVLNATTEANFQKLIVDLAEACGWYVWHDTDSRRNSAGLPDLLMVRGAMLLFLEVKTEKGKVRPAQEAFIERLKQVKYVEADVIRPRHWEQIAAVLRSAKR